MNKAASAPKNIPAKATEGVTPERLAQDPVLLDQVSRAAVQNQDFEGFIALLRQAQQINPAEQALTDTLIRFFMLAGKRSEALPLLHSEYKNNPARDELFFINYLYALETCGELNEAKPVAEQAAKLFPENPLILALKGSLHQSFGEFGEMLESYRKAHLLSPGNMRIAYTLGLHEMMVSDSRAGLEKYALRKRSGKFRGPLYGLPQWQLGNENSKVLAVGEQGIGDTILFTSLLPWLESRTNCVGLVTADKLTPLLARSFPTAKIHSFTEAPEDVAKGYDAYLPLGDLITLCIGEKPAEKAGFLKADTAKTEALRKRYRDLAAKQGAKKIIGVSWESINPHTGMQRSIPLESLLPLLATPGIMWVNLQYGNTLPARDFAQQNGIAWHHDETVDAIASPDDQAAQIAALDGVITSDNSTVHLAGGIGQKTLLLLSAASDWRWGVEKETNRWYPNVRLLRQDTPFSWEKAVKDAIKKIEAGYFA